MEIINLHIKINDTKAIKKLLMIQFALKTPL